MELFNVYEQGNLELVKEISKNIEITRIANILNLKYYSKNPDCIEFLVYKCIEENIEFNWNQVLWNACHFGNIKLIEFIISKSDEKDIELDYISAIYDTCYGDSKSEIKGINYKVNYGIGNKTAERIEIIKFMISKCNKDDINSDIFCLFIDCGYLEIIELVINSVIERKDLDRSKVLYLLIKCKNNKIVNLVIDKMLVSSIINENPFPEKYTEYKRTQLLNCTKLNENLVSLITF
jgi:hypothetical protein